MAITVASPATRAASLPDGAAPRYTSALSDVTKLFFLWGFITSLIDILIPYLKVIFQLSYTQYNLINLCFFGAYFLLSIPAGKLVARVGYKRGMLLGFVLAARGAFVFYPAAEQRSYALFLGALLLISLLLSRVHLPQIVPAEEESSAESRSQAWHYRHLVLGVVGIYVYVGADVATGSHLVSYFALPTVLGLAPQAAGEKVAFYWGGAMVGRFAGAYLLNKFSPSKLLAFNAVGAITMVLISISSTGALAMWSLLAVGLLNSLMFSTIFTLAVAGLGRHTKEVFGLLCTAMVGGAVVPLLFGAVADGPGLRWVLVLPVLCYAHIMWYGLRGSRPTGTLGSSVQSVAMGLSL